MPQLRPADAAVVLGATAHWRGRPNPCLVHRVREGVRLVQEGYAPRLVVSGGLDRRGVLEAPLMREIAVSAGLSPGQVVEEDRSRTTLENLRFTRELMRAHGWQTLILVSEAYHLPRAARMARELGLDFQVSPCAACTERPLYPLAARLREAAASVYHGLSRKNVDGL